MKKNLIARPAMALIALCSFYLQACNNNSSSSDVAADTTTLKKEVTEEKRSADTVSAVTPVDSVVAATTTPAPKIEEAKEPAKTEKSPAKKENSKPVAEKPVAVAPEVDHASIDAGKNLLAASDCLTCHKIQEKAIGPAYVDIAKKYPSSDANIQLLVNKVIAGGSGVWGQIPMTPHPSLQPDDVKKMVKYILSLN